MCWKKLNENEGQAVIEFLFGFMIVISFFFFFVRMSVVFAIANYIHYATFMAARTYASSTSSEAEQNARATAVLESMVAGKFKSFLKPGNGGSGIAVGPGPFYTDKKALDHWNQGATYNFTSKLSLYPWSNEGQSIMLNLTSESWMPREASVEDTKKMRVDIQGILTQALATGGASGTNVNVEWDNGL